MMDVLFYVKRFYEVPVFTQFYLFLFYLFLFILFIFLFIILFCFIYLFNFILYAWYER